MATGTLLNIQNKVRRITRSLDESTLPVDVLNEYINTFILYDFPLRLRLFNLTTTFDFYTSPYVDTYETSDDENNVFFNFKNKYISVDAPIFVAGFNAMLSQSVDEFFNVWPKTASILTVNPNGDGSKVSWTGIVNSQPNTNVNQRSVLLRNNVLFNSIDANNNPLALIDEPVNATYGNLYIPGETKPQYGDSVDAANNINYVTGEFTLQFNTAPAAGQNVYSQAVPVNPSIPREMLFFDGKITLRPVPDKVYKVSMNVRVQPTELMDVGSVPNLSEWWQYIALGAARKVFQDRMDMQSVDMITPEFLEQEAMVESRTLVQQSNQKVPTIYDINDSGRTRNNGFNGSGWF